MDSSSTSTGQSSTCFITAFLSVSIYTCGEVEPITSGETYEFDSVYELEKIGEDELMEVHRADIFGYDEENDEWVNFPYRDSLFTEDGRMAGDVSGNPNHYNVFQFPDLVEDKAQAIRTEQEDRDFTVSGKVEPSKYYHTLRVETLFDGEAGEIEPLDGDVIRVGVNLKCGHTGFTGLKVSPMAYREVCRNGLKDWVQEQVYQQTHSQPYKPELIRHGVSHILDGKDELEQRLADAQSQELRGGREEVRLILHEIGIDDYLDNPVADIPLSIEEEAGDDVTLYDAYQAGTRALTHHSDEELSQNQLDRGYELVAELLDNGSGMRDAEQMAEYYVENRLNQLAADPEAELNYEDEREDVRDLAELHGITA